MLYLRGIVDYASYEGETHRDIKKGPTLIDPSSDEADSEVFNFYGEAGYRWEFSPNYTFTPFVGVDVGHAELEEFTENDPHGTGWALEVDGGEADLVETLVGVRFGGFWDMAGGVFRPDVMVAWAHEFEDDPVEVDMSFKDGPSGAELHGRRSDVSEDALIAGVGGTFDVTNQLQVRHQVGWPVQRGLRLRTRSSVGWNTSSDPTARHKETAGSPQGLPVIFRSMLRVVSHSPSMEASSSNLRRIVKCSPKLSLRHQTALFQQVRSFVEGCRQAMARCPSSWSLSWRQRVWWDASQGSVLGP